MATRVDDRSVEDAIATLCAAIRYHRYQAEAYAEYGEGSEDRHSAMQHGRNALRCTRALAVLTGTVNAQWIDREAVRAADRRVRGD